MTTGLSVVMPAYNEEKYLANAVEDYYADLKKIRDLKSFEIIICVNGSTDNTAKVAKTLAQKHKEVCFVITNRKGIGVAVKLGIERATKEFIAVMPGDGEVSGDFFEKALKVSKDYDFILGSRRLAGEYEGKSIFRKILSHGLNGLISVLLSSKVSEAASNKAFKSQWAKKVAKEFENDGFEWQIEFVYLALRDKLRIGTVPTRVLHKKQAKDSSVNPLKLSLELFETCIRYGLRYRLHQLFSIFP